MISYRNLPEQKAFALSLEQALSDAGIDTWMDIKDIPRLSRWEDEIFKGIIESDYVLICLSPEYLESETCVFECYIARGYGKAILPIIPSSQPNIHIRGLTDQHDATRGLDNLQFMPFNKPTIIGLPESQEDRIARIINAIKKPTPLDRQYDVYISYKVQYGQYATEIADVLNNIDISTFVATRSLDVGADWRRVSWNAIIDASFHIVILSPDINQSSVIANEILVSRTKDTIFIPILPPKFVNDNSARLQIQNSLNENKNLAILNQIQWFIPSDNHQDFYAELVEAINEIRESE
ncbi:MAG: toll/interleukin-1 receptor domain-containing protein [Chloroflexota bacterium]